MACNCIKLMRGLLHIKKKLSSNKFLQNLLCSFYMFAIYSQLLCVEKENVHNFINTKLFTLTVNKYKRIFYLHRSLLKITFAVVDQF